MPEKGSLFCIQGLIPGLTIKLLGKLELNRALDPVHSWSLAE